MSVKVESQYERVLRFFSKFKIVFMVELILKTMCWNSNLGLRDEVIYILCC